LRNTAPPGSIHFLLQLRGHALSTPKQLALLLGLPSRVGNNSKPKCPQPGLSPCAVDEFGVAEHPVSLPVVLTCRIILPRLAARTVVITFGTCRSRVCPSPPASGKPTAQYGTSVAGDIALAAARPALHELLGELLEQPQVGAIGGDARSSRLASTLMVTAR
jgi:hypothetical protein